MSKQTGLLKVESWPVEKVVPYARNPRKNDGVPVAKVKASLKEFGFRQPIVVDAEGVIIVGHTRYQAALELGMKSVPVHVAEGLTAAQVKAYRIADNKTGDFAEWDFDMLKLEFADLQELDFGLDLTGFDDDAIDGIMGEVDPLDSMPELSSEDRQPFQQMTFTLHDEQAGQVKFAIEVAKKQGPFDSENENGNGNALARICQAYVTKHA